MSQTWKNEAVEILKVKKDGSFKLNVEALQFIITKDEIKDRFVSVVSVAGKLRQGKSFILSVFVRYMQYRVKGSFDWLLDKEEPLEGFEYKRSTDSVTSGMLLWSEPFLFDLPSGEKIAVLLMDTQGTFDTTYDKKTSATVFALSCMLSSLQIYNLKNLIGGDDLDHLKLFAAYGKLGVEGETGRESNTNKPPFQKLLFLVRDWENDDCHPYGLDGGQCYLENLIGNGNETTDGIPYFEHKSCCLLPHPGLKVTKQKNSCVTVSDLDHDFKKTISDFVPHILSPEKLVLKEVDGRKITAKELGIYTMHYVKIFGNGKIPSPQSIFEANCEANYNAAFLAAIEFYTTEMMIRFDEMTASIPMEQFDAMSDELTAAAWKTFHDAPKTGKNDKMDKKFTSRLQKVLSQEHESRRSVNKFRQQEEHLKKILMEAEKNALQAEEDARIAKAKEDEAKEMLRQSEEKRKNGEKIAQAEMDKMKLAAEEAEQIRKQQDAAIKRAQEEKDKAYRQLVEAEKKRVQLEEEQKQRKKSGWGTWFVDNIIEPVKDVAVATVNAVKDVAVATANAVAEVADRIGNAIGSVKKIPTK